MTPRAFGSESLLREILTSLMDKGALAADMLDRAA